MIEIHADVTNKIIDCTVEQTYILQSDEYLHREDLIIYMPNYLIDFLQYQHEVNFGITISNDMRVTGIPVLPGYENKIILSPKDNIRRNINFKSFDL